MGASSRKSVPRREGPREAIVEAGGSLSCPIRPEQEAVDDALDETVRSTCLARTIQQR